MDVYSDFFILCLASELFAAFGGLIIHVNDLTNLHKQIRASASLHSNFTPVWEYVGFFPHQSYLFFLFPFISFMICVF